MKTTRWIYLLIAVVLSLGLLGCGGVGGGGQGQGEEYKPHREYYDDATYRDKRTGETGYTTGE